MRYVLSALLLLLLPLPAFADSITAQLTLQTFPRQGEPQVFLRLDAIVTLEPSAGPFWHAFYHSFVPRSNGFVVTSLEGTLGGLPAALTLANPARPSWVEDTVFNPGHFSPGYLTFQSGGVQYAFFDEVTRYVLVGSISSVGVITAGAGAVQIEQPQTFGSPAVPVPEPSTVVLIAIGLLGLISRRRR